MVWHLLPFHLFPKEQFCSCTPIFSVHKRTVLFTYSHFICSQKNSSVHLLLFHLFTKNRSVHLLPFCLFPKEQFCSLSPISSVPKRTVLFTFSYFICSQKNSSVHLLPFCLFPKEQLCLL